MDPVSCHRGGGIALAFVGVLAGITTSALVGVGIGLPARAASPPPIPGTPPPDSRLSIKIAGLRSDKGTVRVALCHTQHCYEERKGFLKEAVIPAALPDVEVRFDGLSAGEYTVMMYHDEDADGKFDRNFIGWPEEGFGFSRNASPGLSAPDYVDVVLRVGHQDLRTQLIVRYW